MFLILLYSSKAMQPPLPLVYILHQSFFLFLIYFCLVSLPMRLEAWKKWFCLLRKTFICFSLCICIFLSEFLFLFGIKLWLWHYGIVIGLHVARFPKTAGDPFATMFCNHWLSRKEEKRKRNPTRGEITSDAGGMIKVHSVSVAPSPRYFNTHFVTVIFWNVATSVQLSARGGQERDRKR